MTLAVTSSGLETHGAGRRNQIDAAREIAGDAVNRERLGIDLIDVRDHAAGAANRRRGLGVTSADAIL